jgi:hypothetical protein
MPHDKDDGEHGFPIRLTEKRINNYWLSEGKCCEDEESRFKQGVSCDSEIEEFARERRG